MEVAVHCRRVAKAYRLNDTESTYDLQRTISGMNQGLLQSDVPICSITTFPQYFRRQAQLSIALWFERK
jgi:hypothetical protein